MKNARGVSVFWTIGSSVWAPLSGCLSPLFGLFGLSRVGGAVGAFLMQSYRELRAMVTEAPEARRAYRETFNT